MTAILKSIHSFEDKFDQYTERFMFHHPYLAFLAIFLGMPFIILIAVAVCTTAAVLPVSLIFGQL